VIVSTLVYEWAQIETNLSLVTLHNYNTIVKNSVDGECRLDMSYESVGRVLHCHS